MAVARRGDQDAIDAARVEELGDVLVDCQPGVGDGRACRRERLDDRGHRDRR
jgi:hypothetical protein